MLKTSELDPRFSPAQKEKIDQLVVAVRDSISQLAVELESQGVEIPYLKEGLYQEILKRLAAEMGGITKAKQALGGP